MVKIYIKTDIKHKKCRNVTKPGFQRPSIDDRNKKWNMVVKKKMMFRPKQTLVIERKLNFYFW